MGGGSSGGSRSRSSGTCPSVPACMAALTAAGGGTLLLPPGITYMGGGSAGNGNSIVFPAPDDNGAPIALVGAGKEATTLLWPQGSGMGPTCSPVTANGTGAWRISDLTLQVNAACQPGAQPPNGMPLLQIPPGSVWGVRIERVRIVNDLGASPGIQLGNAVLATNASFFSLVGVDIIHKGNCAAQWPRNTAVYISENSTDFQLSGLNVTTYCPGYAIASCSRFFLADSVFTSVGDVSEGQGVNTLSQPNVLESFYVGNLTTAGNPSATERWESFTSDGPGGSYNGTVANSSVLNADGTETLTLPAGGPGQELLCRPWAPSTACLPPGQAVAVMRGSGTGQMRRLVRANATSVTVDSPFDPPLEPGDSFISVVGYRGKGVFEGLTLLNGTVFQFYGAMTDTVVAGSAFDTMYDTQFENTTNVAAGVRLFGHRYQGGWEPVWRNLVADNTLTCTTEFVAYSDSIDNVTFSVGHVFRSNAVVGGMDLALNFVSDVVVEHTSFSSGGGGGGGSCVYSGGRVLPPGQVLVNGTSPGTVVR